jgi:hypothetical protein
MIFSHQDLVIGLILNYTYLYKIKYTYYDYKINSNAR